MKTKDQNNNVQALITRLPYSKRFDVKSILEMIRKVDEKGLIFISMPINVEVPSNGSRLICALEDTGLVVVAQVAWNRDRSVVCTRSKRLTNTWEPLVIISRSKAYVINRESVQKIKKGFEGKDGSLEDDDYLCCIGDSWQVRNDRRDRRFLPAQIVLNAGQLADLQKGDLVLDPYGNPGVRDACASLGWKYVDGGLPSAARSAKVGLNNEKSISRNGSDEEEDPESN